MELTSHEARVVLRTIARQLDRAKRNRSAIDVVELTRRLVKKYPKVAEANELRDSIAIQAASAGVPIYFGTPDGRS